MVTSNFSNFSNFPNGLISAHNLTTTSNSPSVFINLSVWCRLHLLRNCSGMAESFRLMGHLTFPAQIKIYISFHQSGILLQIVKKIVKLLQTGKNGNKDGNVHTKNMDGAE